MSSSDNIYFTPERIAETEARIRQILTEVFKLMFDMDISASDLLPNENKGATQASIKMERNDAASCVSILLPEEIAALIIKKLKIDPSLGNKEAVIKDLACEIVNIVGNKLRAFFSESTGVYFEMGMPSAPQAVLSEADKVRLGFSLQNRDPMELDFLYKEVESSKP